MSRSATLLISRQGLYPTRNTPWIAGCLEALSSLASENVRVVSSFNVSTWNAVTALSSHLDLSLRLIVPCESSSDYFRKKSWAEEQFDLAGKDVVWDSLICQGMSAADCNRRRDETVVGLGQLLLPISIRPKGIMDRLSHAAQNEGKSLDRRFAVPYQVRRTNIAYQISENQVSDEIKTLDDAYLIHWTRTCNSVWPGERLIDYYRDVINSERYPRRAINTLLRIVDMRRLIASIKNMPQNTPTVSFSALAPVEAAPLMRWRSRYRQMSFEPYGIGIRKSVAEDAGIRPVIYYDKGDNLPDNAEPWLTQSTGSISDWTAEKEYRYRGDLTLSSFNDDDLVLFVRTADEARFVHEKTGLSTKSFIS